MLCCAVALYTYDILAFQIDGSNVALGVSEVGMAWVAGNSIDHNCPFLEFLGSFPSALRVGVLNKLGEILNFNSPTLQ